jgi:hypothetical protein
VLWAVAREIHGKCVRTRLKTRSAEDARPCGRQEACRDPLGGAGFRGCGNWFDLRVLD